MKLRYRALDRIADWVWVNQQIPILMVEDTSGIMAVDDTTGELVAGCIFDNWTPTSVQAHFMLATPMVLRHDFLPICYDYVFNFKGLKAMFGLVPGNNDKALALNLHMGWTVEARLTDAFAEGIDSVLMSFTRKNWKAACVAFFRPLRGTALR